MEGPRQHRDRPFQRNQRLRLWIVGASLGLTMACAPAAYADGGVDNGHPGPPPVPRGQIVNGEPVAVVLVGPSGPVKSVHHAGPGRSGRWTCKYVPVCQGGGTGLMPSFDPNAPALSPAPGDTVFLTCIDENGQITRGDLVTFNPANLLPGIEV